MRKMVMELQNKTEAARIIGINYHTVLRYTVDIKIRNKPLGERTWNLLREIMEKGYVFTNSKNPSTKIYMLRKHFPKIQWIKIKGRGIAFLPKYKDEAMRALIEKTCKKVWSYQELRKVTKLFDGDLSKEEKIEIASGRTTE